MMNFMKEKNNEIVVIAFYFFLIFIITKTMLKFPAISLSVQEYLDIFLVPSSVFPSISDKQFFE